MRAVTVVCVGKLKERFWREATEEYEKRLSAYCDLRIAEVADEKAPERLSDADRERVLDKEGERILKHIRPQDHCIALAIDGKRRTSEAFAKELGDAMTGGISSVAFVIGGSLGLGEKVLARADRKLSFSDFTFPHQLMRVILLEQVYRAFRILKNEPYHK